MMTQPNPVLLVEDDGEDVELTIAALKKNNIANPIEVARDGVEALDYLFQRGRFQDRAEGHPTVILLDLKMPKMDGVEVLEQVKQDPKLKHIPVVVLTSSREGPDVQRCYELGVNAYVVKPVDFAQFTEAVRELGLFWLVLNQPPD